MARKGAEYIGTMEVQEKHRFDEQSLGRFMSANVEGFVPPVRVEQFKGGQSNPTFRLTTESWRYVLRRKPPGNLLPSAHAVDREFRVISALATTKVPVARAHVLCEDPSVIGTMFYVMDCVDGRVLWDPQLPGMTPEQRRAHFGELGPKGVGRVLLSLRLFLVVDPNLELVFAGAREDGYRALSVLHDSGWSVLLISYRNDPGAPASPTAIANARTCLPGHVLKTLSPGIPTTRRMSSRPLTART